MREIIFWHQVSNSNIIILMHIVTFYSYKGGVGRTMALTNVGLYLASIGKRVLLMDFDLEAPGLDTFEALRPVKKSKGIVDFVNYYIKNNQTPKIRDYIYCSNCDEFEQRLWVMPAGLMDDNYFDRLQKINWKELYEEKNGFFMIEDLKSQIAKIISPDYVLIDSRTGHTDVGGICTRHLPDVNILMFTPNEQSLFGLVNIVKGIRNEEKTKRHKTIKTVFVASNVPTLDDEEDILGKILKRFEESLKISKNKLFKLHRYESLALVKQSVFTLERPKSRLAIEYRKLAEFITSTNPEDKDGAISNLIRLERLRNLPADDYNQIDEIQKAQEKDHTVLFHLAKIRKNQGYYNQALSLIEKAINLGSTIQDAFLLRGELMMIKNQGEDAVKDFMTVLNMEDSNFSNVTKTVDLLRIVKPKEIKKLENSKAIENLDDIEKYFLAVGLSENKRELQIASKIIKEINDPEVVDLKTHRQPLIYIGLGKFFDALSILGPEEEVGLESVIISRVFNYAIAKWGITESPDQELFQKVIEMYMEKDEREDENDANYHQCIGIAFHIINDRKNAQKEIQMAKEKILGRPWNSFSGWEYLEVDPSNFLDHLNEQENMVMGDETILPRIFNFPKGKLN